MTFATLGLHPDILRAVADAGYQAPTPVQAQTIPAALDGRDLMVSSQTGSGKTAAFILPAIHLFATTEQAGLQPPPGNQNKRTRSAAAPARPRMLVLTPTRELALQVTAATDRYSTHVRHVNAASILGGMPYSRQRQALARNPEILVATPGRLMDHMRTGKIDWSQLELLVLDEADRMLDMGFIDAIDSIVASLPQNRQTMLFSATLEGVVGKLGQKITRDPLVVRAAHNASASQENIQQRLHFVDDASHKGRLLDHLLRDLSVDQALVFTSTKREADAIAERLASAGFSAAALHGDMQQNARNRTLDALRRGRLRVLVATDVAARGIDVPSITHVFNFDLPRSPEDYVHRIGRTGRAGRDGFAISLVHHTETSNVRSIERFTRQDIPVDVVPGYEPRRTGGERTRKPGSAGRPGRNAKAGDSKRGWHSKPSKRRNGDSRRSAPGHTSSSFR